MLWIGAPAESRPTATMTCAGSSIARYFVASMQSQLSAMNLRDEDASYMNELGRHHTWSSTVNDLTKS